METSAKDATNVEQAFMAMTADIKNRYISLSCVLVGRISIECVTNLDFYENNHLKQYTAPILG